MITDVRDKADRLGRLEAIGNPFVLYDDVSDDDDDDDDGGDPLEDDDLDKSLSVQVWLQMAVRANEVFLR